MTKFKQILREHKLAIGLAILTSIIVAFPQVYFRIDHQELYKEGIQAIEMLPDSPRSALTREIQDGHLNLGNVNQKDGKDYPYLFQPLGPMVVAYTGDIFGLNINNTLLLSRLIFSFIVFLLIYSFVFLLSRSKFVALSSTSVLLLAASALHYSGISALLHGISSSNFLQMARPVNPAMIYLFLFGFLITFWLFYKKRGNQWLWGVASAILLGLNFYNYFYTWTYLYAFGGLLVLFLLLQKRWKDVLKIISVFLGALVIGTPYIINLYSFTLYSTAAEVGARMGIIETHAPLFVGFSVIASIVIFLLGFPREDKKRYFFSLALILTPFVTMNQQLLTGKVIQASHYHWFFHKPIAVIIVLIIIFHLLTRRGLDFYKKALVILIIVASFAIGIFVQVASYSYDRRDGGDTAIERQRYGPVMDWLNKNAEKEAVVFGNDETSHITVIYTPLNVFYHRIAFASLVSTRERLMYTTFSFYRLRGIDVEDAREVFFRERHYLSWRIYGIYYRELLGSPEAIPDEKIEEILTSYKKTLSVSTSKWLRLIWGHYEVEYIVWDMVADPLWQLEQYSFLEEAAVFGDIIIYKFLK